MILNDDNYYTVEADREYMSVSQYKNFAGTYGKLRCEYAALAKLTGEWKDEQGTALLIGQYVDTYFEGTQELFRLEHPEIFKNNGELKAEYRHADDIIARIERDDYFMKMLSGKKQVIMTGELFGTKWKIKMDSYIEHVAIVDLKIMESLSKKKWIKDLGYMSFVQYWGYDIQGAIYQEIVRQNTGEKLPFLIAAASKEKEPDLWVYRLTDSELNEAMSVVGTNMRRVMQVKNGLVKPDRCELCDCCKRTRVLKAPILIDDAPSSV